MGLRTALGLRKKERSIAANNLPLDEIKRLYDEAKNDNGPKTWWITRLGMYTALQNALKHEDGPDKKWLSISLSRNLGKTLGITSANCTEINFPEANMLSMSFPDETFDFCVSDQVLEHIEGDPIAAFRESVRVVKRGGYICHTTCLINGIHGVDEQFSDFWRFTPSGLRLMAKACNSEVVLADGWGNRDVIPLMETPYRMAPIPDDPDHPLFKLAMRNEERWPITVWVICQRL